MNTEQISEQAKKAAEQIGRMYRSNPLQNHYDVNSPNYNETCEVIQSAITAATVEARAEDAETFAILAGERDELKRHVADLERQLTEARREKYTLEQQLEDAKTDLEAESAKLREQLEEATSLVVQKNRQLGECAESAQVIRQWLTEATAERDQLRASTAEQAKEIERLRERLEEVQTAASSAVSQWDAQSGRLIEAHETRARMVDEEMMKLSAALAKEDKQP